MCADFVLKMHTAATEADIKKAIAAKLNISQKLKPNMSRMLDGGEACSK